MKIFYNNVEKGKRIMIEDIKLDAFPKEAGVYLFKANDEVIYVGSSNNLYKRMIHHRSCIRKGSNHGYEQDLYQYLQTNPFAVEIQLTADYRQLEQELVEKYHPAYNAVRANTGLGARKGREAEYKKKYDQKYKEQKKQYQNQYDNQLCSYNGQTLTLTALSKRFQKAGIPHPTKEAKKYLLN